MSEPNRELIAHVACTAMQKETENIFSMTQPEIQHFAQKAAEFVKMLEAAVETAIKETEPPREPGTGRVLHPPRPTGGINIPKRR